MNIVEATQSYERWLAAFTSLIRPDLRLKHAFMAETPLAFLRATFYRWMDLWPQICPEAAKVPRVLAVGDLHIENFGTWRDAEGRLIWGINDFDEASPLPYTNDLVRLAAECHIGHSPGSSVSAAQIRSVVRFWKDMRKRSGRPENRLSWENTIVSSFRCFEAWNEIHFHSGKKCGVFKPFEPGFPKKSQPLYNPRRSRIRIWHAATSTGLPVWGASASSGWWPWRSGRKLTTLPVKPKPSIHRRVFGPTPRAPHRPFITLTSCPRPFDARIRLFGSVKDGCSVVWPRIVVESNWHRLSGFEKKLICCGPWDGKRPIFTWGAVKLPGETRSMISHGVRAIGCERPRRPWSKPPLAIGRGGGERRSAKTAAEVKERPAIAAR